MNLIKEQKKDFYPSLNGLRAISIFFVIFHHLEIRNNIFSKHFPSLSLLNNFITDGQLGVNVFFVISGFLITSLLIKEEIRTGSISIKNFFIRRTLRIFPAYYFYLIVLFFLQLNNLIYITNSSWLTAVTYTKYFNWNLDWYTSHGWSLSIEEHFYLLFPLIFLLGNKWRKIATIIIIASVPLIKIYNYYYPISWLNDLTIFYRIDALAIGCLIGFYREILLEFFTKNFKALFYISILIIFFIGPLVTISQKLNLNLNFIIIPFGTRHGTISNICIGIILLYSIFEKRGIWFRLLNTKVLNTIGILSYSIYLWQQLFTSGMKSWVTSFPINLFFIFSAALFSYHVIEKPFLKFKDKFHKPQNKELIHLNKTISQEV